jgi:cation:H+ antiporter
MTDLLFIALGLGGLYFGGEWLVQGASRLALRLGVSVMVIGLTVVAVGTSMPELIVGISASLQGSNGIITGNIIGSNIANLTLILGLTAMINAIRAEWSFVRRELPIMLGVAILGGVVALDGVVSQVEGIGLFLGYGVYTAFSIWLAGQESKAVEAELKVGEEAEGVLDPNEPHPSYGASLGRIVAGLVFLVVGAQLLVTGASNIARSLNIPEVIIGLTLVAVGTSLPELTTSLIASIRKHNEIVLGNVVGSNIANILLILGLTAILRPIAVEPALIRVEIPVMIGVSVLILIFLSRQRLTRWQGVILVVAYIVFTIYSFIGNRP